MIEKLKKQNTWGECLEKLNEVIDAVNELQTRAENVQSDTESRQENVQKETFVSIDEALKMGKKVDPFAEQRKWIGKVCWFWDDDEEEKCFSVLEYIHKNSPYPYCARDEAWFKHCELVKPDDDIIYKGE